MRYRSSWAWDLSPTVTGQPMANLAWGCGLAREHGAPFDQATATPNCRRHSDGLVPGGETTGPTRTGLWGYPDGRLTSSVLSYAFCTPFSLSPDFDIRRWSTPSPRPHRRKARWTSCANHGGACQQPVIGFQCRETRYARDHGRFWYNTISLYADALGVCPCGFL